MFKALMICAIIGLAVARPDATVVHQSDDVRADGFKSELEVDNSISEKRDGDEHGNIHGDFSWISPEGEHVAISYVADENGYQPSGAVLPTPPPVPVEIARALEWLAAHPSAEYDH